MFTIPLLISVLAALATTSTPAPVPPTTVAAATPPAAAATTTVAATTTTTGATTTVPSGPTTTIPIPTGYVPLVDDTHAIVLAVPAAWQEINTAPFIQEEGTDQRPSIVASPDIESFYSGFDVPGVSFFTIPYTDDPVAVMGDFALTGGCKTLAVKEYDDPYYTGIVQIGTDCGATPGMTWDMVIASPADHSYTAVVQVQSTDQTEIETVLRTFNTVVQ